MSMPRYVFTGMQVLRLRVFTDDTMDCVSLNKEASASPIECVTIVMREILL
jgi:hypothetical protein